ncbi:MAG TPA: dTDP-4-dehydrorhamnose 3,5-epimerase [Syntrophales bacterium]|nr:dTDP-4-dehydrorhamnose 3,5-epimerase [Syntrophales bacterium]HOM07440.1 dTDP-4-dehydrorhamnose 3,5-epimerase [Syntrophales bacterium]HON99929.1 dTDP-4-dehydrorhamnose 3,5-epimerase [Syntrophales bacterium]HPC01417.1 dTDP-4-dehydrorhamnose 3,5-epimerase [Syntrophales bacterium]HPQ06951.1 dTDP-4-dehydrorhamnose 3,5-epimerase [Syntrophales bacterium]
MPFTFRPAAIPEVIIVEAARFDDPRGYFMETYKASAFAAGGIPGPFLQDNVSYSIRGTLRGLHYQKRPHEQGKLVMVLSGEIYDVAVDIRPHSATYGRWVGEVLSAANRRFLYIPEGFAHGFQCLSAEAIVAYKVTKEFDLASDRGIRWNDPTVGIAWPLPDPLLSPKDAALPPLAAADNNF